MNGYEKKESVTLLQKTFETCTSKELDIVCNAFKVNKKVKATQINLIWTGTQMVYIATLFYEAD